MIGVKGGPSGLEKHVSGWINIPEDEEYQRFDGSANGARKANWMRLVIESRKRGTLDECAVCLEVLTDKNS
ncbi:hypothetical protein M427DRAFT_131356 [Gonapodya prolifera JEL478]|uniref:Uncharacterized protein n=1 Tax=Gonapodya prolifera (strain JEL478) TaxID=1344416 RepID=A0A139AV22_GONPJ|nr:hypothetical protein M427DRAFT_131356 [Gonapodya prolifera JEL478]|eukprot:KXS20581.1 hypothetical protein M427DRAFT_131356 [Gonapodya prolifera JEL478]